MVIECREFSSQQCDFLCDYGEFDFKNDFMNIEIAWSE